jgi:hypothetical protein
MSTSGMDNSTAHMDKTIMDKDSTNEQGYHRRTPRSCQPHS